ncbi:MAG: PH domain-containing protein [Propionibacteriaceae bacterium]
MSNAIATETNSEDQTKKLLRPHPLTAVVRGWVGLLGLVYAMARDSDVRAFIVDPTLWHKLPVKGVALAVSGIIAVFGLVGVLLWWFTRYIVDTEELRIETGFLIRQQKQISVERIQSVDVVQRIFPRLLGLAEVKIDVGADAATRLRYLTRQDAYDMRDFLMHKIHRTSAIPAGQQSLIEHVRDVGVDERVLIQLPPARLIATALLHPSYLMLLSGVVFGLALMPFTASGAALAIPCALGIVSVAWGHINGQWNYRLLQSDRGIKISRGLLDLTSQSVPVHRMQGLKISQPLTWRLFGWYRVEVDVLGYGHGTSDDAGTSSLLLPCGTIEELGIALSSCLPEFHRNAVQLQQVSPKHRYFHPIAWRGTRYGIDESFLVIERGVWRLRTYLVPHQRIQSVRVQQGPIDKKLGIARVSADTAPGPVHAMIAHCELGVAVAFATAELDRATAMRRAELAKEKLGSLEERKYG